ncbi:MAG: glyoxalase superfamily protein [Pseudomonadales bacterium]|jgi:catechol 2,3-dioxygenase-like lactoylglutathione lyase family enzyme|nr:glyoxalase superfamily protein [Pseudomonadales bacterium]
MRIGTTTPILRSFDETEAKRFYVDYLGFTVDWEHRFEPGLPLYMQVSREGCVLHVSEHHGDCSPGAALRIAVEDLDALHAELTARGHPRQRPGIEAMPFGTRDMALLDPFHNRLIFTEAAGDA